MCLLSVSKTVDFLFTIRMDSKTKKIQTIEFAENIREACIKAAQEGFMYASMSGLCTGGAMEAAISAIQSLNLKKNLNEERQS